MKRTLLIIFGVVLLALVLGIWVYLLVFGVPEEADDVFANLDFGFGSEPAPVVTTPPTPITPESQVDVGDPLPLRQLTTKPVAGFTYLSGSSTDRIRFVERGTGHVYDIDLSSGQETRISGTTIPRISDAHFSPSGRTLALTSFDGYARTTVVGTLTTETEGGSLTLVNLPQNASDIHLPNDEVAHYVALDTRGVRLETLNLSSESVQAGAVLPFRDIRMLWDTDESGTDYFYNKPDSEFESTLYRVTGTSFASVDQSAYGLVASLNNDYLMRTYNNTGELVSESTELNSGQSQPLALITIPEKCAWSSVAPTQMWCGATLEERDVTFATNWYKGIESPADQIWQVNLPAGEATLYADPMGLVSREIDIQNLQTNQDDTALLFMNKRDSTLWLYDLTI